MRINKADVQRAGASMRQVIKRLTAEFGTLSKEVEKATLGARKLGRSMPKQSKGWRKHVRRKKAEERR